MSVDVLEMPVAGSSLAETDPDIIHLVCLCDTQRSLCGYDTSEAPWADLGLELERECAMCVDTHFNNWSCPRCLCTNRQICGSCLDKAGRLGFEL